MGTPNSTDDARGDYYIEYKNGVRWSFSLRGVQRTTQGIGTVHARVYCALQAARPNSHARR